MLTSKELNEVQGLIHYLNSNLKLLKPDNIKLIDSNGEASAELQYAVSVGEYVLVNVTD